MAPVVGPCPGDGADEPASQASVGGGDAEADPIGQVDLDGQGLGGRALGDAQRDGEEGRRPGATGGRLAAAWSRRRRFHA